ncbi:hypothetical protein PoB_002317700 [Plakobranchus ocellatus]|uniref:SEA domain-containing protein n=1 Tax=Plakobranchus ocellatus TaxID=259542 RepID=A0AAV3ZPS4_9GAST|nr:hypothetical protein PoB_002317700 [Plakobranchus ocellatus]
MQAEAKYCLDFPFAKSALTVSETSQRKFGERVFRYFDITSSLTSFVAEISTNVSLLNGRNLQDVAFYNTAYIVRLTYSSLGALSGADISDYAPPLKPILNQAYKAVVLSFPVANDLRLSINAIFIVVADDYDDDDDGDGGGGGGSGGNRGGDDDDDDHDHDHDDDDDDGKDDNDDGDDDDDNDDGDDDDDNNGDIKGFCLETIEEIDTKLEKYS